MPCRATRNKKEREGKRREGRRMQKMRQRMRMRVILAD